MSADTLAIDVRVRLEAFELSVTRSIEARGVTALFGPSGSGKTTLLRILAGFEPRATGRVTLGDAVWLDSDRRVRLPAHRRPVGYMFQDARLFSHLEVEGNLRFAERRRSDRRPSISREEVVDALDLGPLLLRRVDALSGGERQRVALGRTLLTAPRLLLLDEPLSALDARRRREILPYVQALHPRFGIPILYVSHALDEVALLADRILVLSEGRVHAAGPTAEIVEHLEPWPVGDRAGTAVVVEARVTRQDERYRLTWLDLAGQTLSVPCIETLSAGETARLLIHARDVSLATRRPTELSIRNVLAGRVTEIRQAADSPFAEVTVDLGPCRVRSRITRASVDELGLAVDTPVFALVKSVSLDSSTASAPGADREPDG